MHSNPPIRRRSWRSAVPASLLPCLFLLLIVMSNAGNPYMAFMAGNASRSDAPVNMSPDVLPSTLSYTLQKSAPGLVAGDDVVVSTTLPVTQTSMAFENISVQPITVPVETYSEYYLTSTHGVGTLYFQEIKVPSTCYVKWLSMYVQYVNTSLPIVPANSWNVSIYNATSSFPELAPTPHQMVPGSSVIVDPRYDTGPVTQYMGHWENITLGNVLLNSSKTLYQGGYHHFFVAVLLPPVVGHLWWYSNDTTGLADDNGKAYRWYTFPFTAQRLSSGELNNMDFDCVTKLFPVNGSPKPTDIGLTVNNEPVANVAAGTGIYNTAELLKPVNDIVSFDVASAWGAYPGGSFRCDSSLTYTVRDTITPQVQARVYPANSSVAWRANFAFSQAAIKGQGHATLAINVPNSWTTIMLFNTTGTTPVQVVGTTTASPTGKFKVFTADGITPGTWRFDASSATINPSVSLNIGGAIDISNTITGTMSIPYGPNGRVISLRSDFEGGISSIAVSGGDINTTLTSAVASLDGKSVRFSNKSGIDLDFINSKVEIGQYTGKFAVNGSADTWVDLPDNFRMSDVQDLELVFDQQSFDASWWWGNITGAAMPGNTGGWLVPPTITNIAQAFYKLLEVDLDPIVMNFTYDNSPSERHYADVYMNFSLNVFNQIAVPRNAITSMTFDVVTNFTAAANHQVVYIRNQTSPTKEWILMSNVAKQPEILWFLHERWSSEGEPAMQNITQFISPVSNTVEMRMRTYNDTTVPTGSGVKRHYFVDQALLNFTYTDSFKSFDMQVYNWTDSNFEPTIMKFYATAGKGTTVISLGNAFSNQFSGLIDPATGKVRIRVGAEATTPFANIVWWDIDRLMLNVTYTSYARCSWNQTVYNSAGGITYSSQHETLYDVPVNNFTVAIPVITVLDYYDNYNYTMIWTNGTAIMYYRDDFSINRYSTTCSLASGIAGEYAKAGSVMQVQIALIYTMNGSGVPEQPVAVILHFNTGGTNTIIGFTNAHGIASVPIQFDDSWDSITYEVEYTPSDPRFKPSAVATSESIPVYNDLEFIGYLLRTYWFIIVPAIAVILIGAIAKRGADAKKKRQWKADANRIRDVVKIQHLMVIQKSSGACLVNRSYSQMQIDGDLISGFLHAIATFGKEVGGDRGASAKKSSGDAIVFDYQDFKILLSEGAQVRLALILNGPPTDGLKERARQFIAAFEASHDMQSWRGNLDIFNGVDSFIEQAFEITLVYPLVVNPKKAKKEIKSGLGKALYEVGEAVQKEKQAFYLATLLHFAQAGRKESQDHVLGEIYQLKKQGFLTFYNPQAAQSA